MKEKIKDRHGNEFELLTIIEGVGVYTYFGTNRVLEISPLRIYAISSWPHDHSGDKGNKYDWAGAYWYLEGGHKSFTNSGVYQAGYPDNVEDAILEFVNTHFKLRT